MSIICGTVVNVKQRIKLVVQTILAIYGLTKGIAYARILWQQRNTVLLIRSDTQEAEGAPLLRE